MGNSPSKQKNALTRSDTHSSHKSQKLLRFKKSSRLSSFVEDKTSVNGDGNGNGNNSGGSGGGNSSGAGEDAITNNDAVSLSNSTVPPSMIQIKPKDPILLRKNSDYDEMSTSVGTNNVIAGNASVSNVSVSSGHATGNSRSGSFSGGGFSRSGSFNNGISNSGSNSGSFSNLSNSGNLLNTNSIVTNTSFNDSNSGIYANSNGAKLSRTSTNNSLNTPLSPQTTGGDAKSIASSLNSRVPSSDNLPSLNLSKLSTKTSITKIATNDDNFIDIEDLIQRLLDAGYSGKRTKNVCLKNSEIQIICSTAREIFLSQPSLLELSPPVKVVGDVHGQYGDLIRVFTKCGFPPSTNYLFLGDYVDRGKQSLETILLLLCYKIKYPENFFLLRGNHECANVTRVYGFYDECKRRCNIKTWKIFVDTFNTLPIAAIVAGKIFCVHGGLSPVLSSMDEIRNIARPTDVPDFGLLNDLLWSDPADTQNEWEDNERGVSYVFSKVAINKFLTKFGFDLVCRAHMVVEDGYEFFNDRTLVTVFSAPNYCGEFDNWGAVMSVSEELLCSFELLDPLDSVALKQVMKKGKQERKNAQIGGSK